MDEKSTTFIGIRAGTSKLFHVKDPKNTGTESTNPLEEDLPAVNIFIVTFGENKSWYSCQTKTNKTIKINILFVHFPVVVLLENVKFLLLLGTQSNPVKDPWRALGFSLKITEVERESKQTSNCISDKKDESLIMCLFNQLIIL